MIMNISARRQTVFWQFLVSVPYIVYVCLALYPNRGIVDTLSLNNVVVVSCLLRRRRLRITALRIIAHVADVLPSASSCVAVAVSASFRRSALALRCLHAAQFDTLRRSVQNPCQFGID